MTFRAGDWTWVYYSPTLCISNDSSIVGCKWNTDLSVYLHLLWWSLGWHISSSPLLNIPGEGGSVSEARSGLVDNGRDLCERAAAWQALYQRRGNTGPTPGCRWVFGLHQSHRLLPSCCRAWGGGCSTQVARRGERVWRREAMTSDTCSIGWERGIHRATGAAASWCNQGTRKLPSDSLNVSGSITVAAPCITLQVAWPEHIEEKTLTWMCYFGYFSML